MLRRSCLERIMAFRVTCVLFGLLWFTYTSYGCSCRTSHNQNIFCRKNVVVFVGKVTKGELLKTTSSRRYHLKLIKSLKGIRKPVDSTIMIWTSRSGSSFGISLSKGKTYLMSGYRDKTGKISTYSCGSFVLSTTSLSFEQMIYFFSSGPDSYKRNCACKEIMNSWSKPELFDPKKGCKIKESRNSCNYRKTGLCKREGGMCSWKNVECEKA